MSIRFYVNNIQPFCGSLRPKHTESFLMKEGIKFAEDDANIIEPQIVNDVQGLLDAISNDCKDLGIEFNPELDEIRDLSEVTVEQI
ncbi:MAG: hypothetical protein MJZ34_02645 [Paludibacteraceae bacterium]|nr:hypothetical protein [Paludibacteraceae bacterium]